MASPTSHSRLFSPSGSKRWLQCAASAILSAVAPPEPDNPAALEGTLAHHVAETMIRRNWFEYARGAELTPVSSMKGTKHKGQVCDEMMCQYIQGYVDAIFSEIKKPSSKVWIEQRIDYSESIGQPIGSAFGTADAIVYLPDEDVIKVFDLKYGKWEVLPENNTQAMIYCLAVLWKTQFLFAAKNIEITIYQPRTGTTPDLSWFTTTAAIWIFSRYLRDRAAAVKMAEAAYYDGADIPITFYKVTDECRFCRAEKCKARKNQLFKFKDK